MAVFTSIQENEIRETYLVIEALTDKLVDAGYRIAFPKKVEKSVIKLIVDFEIPTMIAEIKKTRNYLSLQYPGFETLVCEWKKLAEDEQKKERERRFAEIEERKRNPNEKTDLFLDGLFNLHSGIEKGEKGISESIPTVLEHGELVETQTAVLVQTQTAVIVQKRKQKSQKPTRIKVVMDSKQRKYKGLIKFLSGKGIINSSLLGNEVTRTELILV